MGWDGLVGGLGLGTGLDQTLSRFLTLYQLLIFSISLLDNFLEFSIIPRLVIGPVGLGFDRFGGDGYYLIRVLYGALNYLLGRNYYYPFRIFVLLLPRLEDGTSVVRSLLVDLHENPLVIDLQFMQGCFFLLKTDNFFW